VLRIGYVGLLTTLLCFSSLSAQESAAASPFHAGQWAMQFGGGANLFDLGVLHFTSPTAAWLLDLSTSSVFIDATSTSKISATTTRANQQQLNLAARLGRRSYHTGRPRVVSFRTVAVESGWSDQLIDVTAGTVRLTQWNAGLNGELGGAYLLTEDVSVGGTADLSAGYLSYKRTDPGAAERGHGFYHQYRVLVALGLYF
jgi:hypothetical protein